jgi:hypothetical protein
MPSSKDNLGHRAPHPAATTVNSAHSRGFEATEHGHFRPRSQWNQGSRSDAAIKPDFSPEGKTIADLLG